MDDAALHLLQTCIAAEVRELDGSGIAATHAYTLRAAVIYRRLRDFASEVEVLERWIGSSPEPHDPHSRVAIRLTRARRLLNARRTSEAPTCS